MASTALDIAIHNEQHLQSVGNFSKSNHEVQR